MMAGRRGLWVLWEALEWKPRYVLELVVVMVAAAAGGGAVYRLRGLRIHSSFMEGWMYLAGLASLGCLAWEVRQRIGKRSTDLRWIALCGIVGVFGPFTGVSITQSFGRSFALQNELANVAVRNVVGIRMNHPPETSFRTRERQVIRAFLEKLSESELHEWNHESALAEGQLLIVESDSVHSWPFYVIERYPHDLLLEPIRERNMRQVLFDHQSPFVRIVDGAALLGFTPPKRTSWPPPRDLSQ